MAGRHGIVSAEAADDLRGVQRALDAAPAELDRLLTATAREQLSAAWGDELGKRPATKVQRKFLLAESKALPGSAGLTVTAGSNLGVNAPMARILEFGTNDREKVSTYTRRHPKSGKQHRVTRHTRRQLPARKAGGYVIYPAANKLGTRVFAMWGQLISKVTHDWMEGNIG